MELQKSKNLHIISQPQTCKAVALSVKHTYWVVMGEKKIRSSGHVLICGVSDSSETAALF
jgi:hypothetical protein